MSDVMWKVAGRTARKEKGRSAAIVVATAIPTMLVSLAGGGLNPFMIAAGAVTVALSTAAPIALATSARMPVYGRLAAIGASPDQLRALVRSESLLPGGLGVALGAVLAVAFTTAVGGWFPWWFYLLSLPGTAVTAWLGIRLAITRPASRASELSAHALGRADQPAGKYAPRTQFRLGVLLVVGSLVAGALLPAFYFWIFALLPLLTIAGLALITSPLIAATSPLGTRLPQPVQLSLQLQDRFRYQTSTAATTAIAICFFYAMAAAGFESDREVRLPAMSQRFVLTASETSADRIEGSRGLSGRVPLPEVRVDQFAPPPLHLTWKSGDETQAFQPLRSIVLTDQMAKVLNISPSIVADVQNGSVLLSDGVAGEVSVGMSLPPELLPVRVADLGFGSVDGAGGEARVAIIGQRMADDLGLQPLPGPVPTLLVSERALSEDDIDAIMAATVGWVGVSEDDLSTDTYLLAFSIMGSLALIATLVTTTALSRPFDDPSTSTLVAHGASPRLQRTVPMARAGILGLLGAGLGLPFGLISFWSVTRTDPSVPGFVVPPLLGLLIVGVAAPVVATMVTGLRRDLTSPIGRVDNVAPS